MKSVGLLIGLLLLVLPVTSTAEAFGTHSPDVLAPRGSGREIAPPPARSPGFSPLGTCFLGRVTNGKITPPSQLVPPSNQPPVTTDRASQPPQPTPCLETCDSSIKKPVKCTATLWVDDMGIRREGTAENECSAKKKFCAEVGPAFKPSDVREIEKLTCTEI